MSDAPSDGAEAEVPQDGTEALAAALPTSSRRRPRTLALWGVLAVLAVGAAALAVRSGNDDPPRLPVALGSSAGAGERSSASPMSADMKMAAWVTYVAGDDLPVLGGSGPAYRLHGTVDEAVVRRLAGVFGLEGTPTEQDGYWTLETDAGMLQAYPGGGGTWWYSSVTGPRAVTDVATSSGGGTAESCAADKCIDPVPLDPPVSDCPPDADCAQPEPFVPPADLPSKDEARTIALDLLRKVDADVDHAKVTVDGPYDSWYVTVEPAVDGATVSGYSFSVSVGPKGAILAAGGSLAKPERLGDYPVLDTRATIDRLNAETAGYATGAEDSPLVMQDTVPGDEATTTIIVDEGAGSGRCETLTLPDGTTEEQCSEPAPYPCLAPQTAVADDGTTTEMTPPPDLPSTAVDSVPPTGAAYPIDCGPYVEPEPVEITLHGAERILVMVYANDNSGDAYLVPGYRFTGDQDTVLDQPAVDDDSLLPPPVVPDGREPSLPDPGGTKSTPAEPPVSAVATSVGEPK